MLPKSKLSVIIVISLLFASCNHKTSQGKQVQLASAEQKVKDTVIVPSPPRTAADNLVSFIAGMPHDENACFKKADSLAKWNHYSKRVDSIFTYADTSRMKKMHTWADSQLVKIDGIKTVFYPFSGPDFLNVNIFYPDADRYIFIGMEPIGTLPDVCKMNGQALTNYTNSMVYTLKDLLKRSYFITSHMNEDLSRTKINGIVPMLTLLIKRTGHDIVSIKMVGIDSAGRYVTDSLNRKNVVEGVKVDFTSGANRKVQSVIYFRTDISDEGLKKHKGFQKYLTNLPRSYTYLKAASFLMHYETFGMIRSDIFRTSVTILQDDSGIAYKYFDKQKWDIRLYGKYSQPKGEFSFIREPDLEQAFQKSVVKPLPFYLGYNWRSDHTSLLYAIKK